MISTASLVKSMSKTKAVIKAGMAPAPRFTPDAYGVPEPSHTAQLSRLSSVLNGLENGAARMRGHLQQAVHAVRSGTYSVDPLQLSRRIVGEAIGSA